jgi:hypothetical protein
LRTPLGRSGRGAYLLIAALLAWFAYAAYYVLSPLAPHDFAADLGYSIVGVGRIGALATSWSTVAAMPGWGIWNDFSTFVYAPLGQYALALPMELFFRDPMRTVKFEQVLAFSMAFFGTAWLYASIFGRSAWRWFAATVYAAIPLSAALIQWDGDFAWIVGLAPLAVAASLALVRRYGNAAYGVAGVLCGLTTFGFSIEHGMFVGLPMLAFVFAVRHRDGVRFPILAALFGLVTFGLSPAFVVVMTVYGPHVMWWTQSTQSEFSNDGFGLRALYSQTLLDQIAGVYREQLLIAEPLYDAKRPYPFAAVAGIALWALALAACAYGRLSGGLRRWWPAIAIGAACLILSLGAALPVLGPLIWNGVARVPILDALRTPDRFAQFNGLLMALAAAYGASRLARGSPRGRAIAIAGVAVTLLGYGAYDVRTHVLGFDPLSRLPDFDRANAAVAALGGRTAVFGVPQDGDVLDFASYAPTNPSVQFAWNLYQRNVDADGGAALLRRAAVRSIVTTPAWTVTTVAGFPPNLAIPIARSPVLLPPSILPSGVEVFAVASPRPAIAPVLPVCAIAGPAGFELAAADPILDGATLEHGAVPGCVRGIIADGDPLDTAVPTQAVAAWFGNEVFGDSASLASPNAFEFDRMELTTPWYRHAYAGDSLLAPYPYQTAGQGSGHSVSFPIAKPGRYDLYVRAAGPASFSIIDTDGHPVVGTNDRINGFRWTVLPIGNLTAGQHDVTLTIFRSRPFRESVVVDEMAVAPERLDLSGTRTDAALVSAREFAPALGIAGAPAYVFPKFGAPSTAQGQRVTIDPQATVGVYNDELEIRTTATTANHMRFYWDGPTGRYVVEPAAWIPGIGARLEIRSSGERLVARYDPTMVPTQLFGLLDLRHGAPIDVLLTANSASPLALAQLVVAPVVAYEAPNEYDEHGEEWQYDAAFPFSFVEATHSLAVLVTGGAVRAPYDTVATIPFRPDLQGGTVTADVKPVSGDGFAELRCGAISDSSTFGAGTMNPTGVDLALTRSGNDACTLRVRWMSSDFAMKSVRIRAASRTLLNWSAPQYFAPGDYVWSARDAAAMDVTIDGRPWAAGRPLRLAGGIHNVVLRRAPLPVPTLHFARSGAWPLVAPGAAIVGRSATEWNVRAPVATTVEVAQLNDGNWFASGPAYRASGYECDLVNTCLDVPAGVDVNIGRTLPHALALGMEITGLDIAAVILVLVLFGRKKRAPGSAKVGTT